MKIRPRVGRLFSKVIFLWIFLSLTLTAQDRRFHNAPPSSQQKKNPYAGQAAAVKAGERLYALNCRSCHGINGKGNGNVPALSRGAIQTVPDGEIFWFITTGSVENGMPSWAQLSEQKRWQIVTYLKTLKNARSTAAPAASLNKFRRNMRSPAMLIFID